MTSVSNQQPTIIRTERGLTISGTRITLYDVMDYIKAQYPPKFIEKLGLKPRPSRTAFLAPECNASILQVAHHLHWR
jgi:hypothetical protein